MKNNALCKLATATFALSITFGCGTGSVPPSDEQTSTSRILDEAPGRSFSEGFIDGCEGHALSYQKWTDDSSAYGTLIFATGRTEYTDKYHHLLPLIRRNLDIVFYDHFGQGRSDGVRAHVNSIEEEHACDLKKVIDELTDPNKPRFLLSHSMGGLSSMRAIQLNPDMVEAAVFSAPMWGLVLPEGFTEETALQAAEMMVENGSAEVPMSEASETVASCEEAKLTHDCELYDQFASDPLTAIGPATWGAAVAFLKGITNMNASLGDVAVPVHVFTAGDEYYVDSKSHPLVCDGINAIHPGRCTRDILENDWHEVLNEVDRDAYMETALSFFDKHMP